MGFGATKSLFNFAWGGVKAAIGIKNNITGNASRGIGLLNTMRSFKVNPLAVNKASEKVLHIAGGIGYAPGFITGQAVGGLTAAAVGSIAGTATAIGEGLITAGSKLGKTIPQISRMAQTRGIGAKHSANAIKIGKGFKSFMGKNALHVAQITGVALAASIPLYSNAESTRREVFGDVNPKLSQSAYSTYKIMNPQKAMVSVAGTGYETMATKYSLGQNMQMRGDTRMQQSTQDLTLALYGLRHRGLF